jgi:CRP/FNR family transcriptional regulator
MSRASKPLPLDFSRADVIALLRRGCWAQLPPETIDRLTTGGRISTFPDGFTVYSEADAAAVAVIVRGLIRVYMHAGDGRQVTVRYVRPGELLGVPALVGGPAPVFVQAITAGAAFFFDAARVRAIARSDPAIAWSFAEESVHRLYDVLEELAGNAFASVRQRVARHLLDLAASRPATDGRLVALVSQQDLANSVGSVREVVARVLGELRADRIISTSTGRIVILEPVRLSHELWSRTRDQSYRREGRAREQ